jgi:hypothetical protein
MCHIDDAHGAINDGQAKSGNQPDAGNTQADNECAYKGLKRKRGPKVMDTHCLYSLPRLHFLFLRVTDPQ